MPRPTKNVLSSEEDSSDESPKNTKNTHTSNNKSAMSSDSNRDSNNDDDDLQVRTDETISSSSSDVSAEEEGKFPDGYDKDCVGDAHDRSKLNKMSEIDREAELYQRMEAREILINKKKYQRKLKIERKERRKKRREIRRKKRLVKSKSNNVTMDSDDSDNELSTNVRKSGKRNAMDSDDSDIPRRKKQKPSKSDSSDSDTAIKIKKSKLKAPKSSSSEQEESDSADDEYLTAAERQKKLKARQLKKLVKSRKDRDKRKNQEQKLKVKDVYGSDSSESEADEKGRKNGGIMSDSSSNGELNSESDDYEDEDDRPIKSVEELSLVKLSRFRCEQWCHMPFFEEIVKGMYIRIGLGLSKDGKETYRCAEVLNVLKCAKVYDLGPTRTNQALNIKIGSTKKGFRLNYLSNQPFTESEFGFYKEQMEKNSLSLPNFRDIKNKAKEVEKMKKKEEADMTQKEFESMVEKKKRFRHKPTSYAKKKSQLIKERQDAEASKNMLLMKRVDKELDALDKEANQINIERMGEATNANSINDKIRSTFHNKQKQEAVIESNRKYRVAESVNPFMRRKTTPMMGSGQEVINGLQGKYKSDVDRTYETGYTHKNTNVKKKEPSIETTNKKKRQSMHDAHNFELDIDIPLNIG